MHGRNTQRIDTIVIGAGQAGLSAGYHLAKRGLPFVILDADERIGDHWRERWDSLRLYSPARYDSLPGMRFPAPSSHWPTAREMADYLEAYARRFGLPILSGTRVDRLEPVDDGFVVSTADGTCLAARQVIVATGPFRQPNIPAFAAELDPSIRPAALARVPQSGPAQDGPRPCRRPVALRRRHRVRGRPRRPPDDPVRQVARPDAHPGHRYEARHARLASRRFRVRTRSDDAHADGAADAPGGPKGRRPAPSSSPWGPGPGRRRAPRRKDRQRTGRPPGARRRHGARRGERDLGHRVPARLRVRHSADRRCRTAGRSRSVGSARPCRACTSSASRSSTPSRRCSWPAPAATRDTSSRRWRSERRPTTARPRWQPATCRSLSRDAEGIVR